MEDEVLPADKRHRRLVILAAIVLSFVGVLALVILSRHLREVKKLAQDDLPAAEEKAIRLVRITVWIVGLGLVGMGGWLWRLGRRINLAGRFPPPGMKVVKQTRVRTGATARARANLAQAFALLCVVAGTVGMWYLYRLGVAVLGH